MTQFSSPWESWQLRQASTQAAAEEEPAADFDPFGKKQRYPQPQRPPADPWTPTQQLRKRKTLPKRMGFLMKVLEDEQVQQKNAQRRPPKFDAGDLLEVRMAVPENQGRPATIRGICIARRERGIRTSFTLRNHIGAAGAFERYSPIIQSISVLGSRRVRRAKLYYLRDRNPKESRVA